MNASAVTRIPFAPVFSFRMSSEVLAPPRLHVERVAILYKTLDGCAVTRIPLRCYPPSIPCLRADRNTSDGIIIEHASTQSQRVT